MNYQSSSERILKTAPKYQHTFFFRVCARLVFVFVVVGLAPSVCLYEPVHFGPVNVPLCHSIDARSRTNTSAA